MKYYQVIKQVEGIGAPVKLNYLLVKNELFTAAEVKKLGLSNSKNLRIVDAPKSKTFFSFGCRFNTELDCF